MTILLGLLMRSSETSRSTILNALNKKHLSQNNIGSSSSHGFRAFVAHAAEFVEFYDKVTQRILRSSSISVHPMEVTDDEEDYASHSKGNLARALQEKSENAVAREVLEYLRSCLS
jgi:hypothetical protein